MGQHKVFLLVICTENVSLCMIFDILNKKCFSENLTFRTFLFSFHLEIQGNATDKTSTWWSSQYNFAATIRKNFALHHVLLTEMQFC